MSQGEKVNQFLNLVLRRRLGQIVHRRDEFQILPDIQFSEVHRPIQHKTDMSAIQEIHIPDQLIEDYHFTASPIDETSDYINQCALTRTVWTNKPEQPPFLNFQT